MKDFWLSCGHHLTDRDGDGRLVIADARQPVRPEDIAGIEDADARENWQFMIAFRDHLLAHRTLEAAYLALVRAGMARTPPIFVNQLVHVIMRNVLDGCEDPFLVRAAELFFRPQVITLHEGSLLAADQETIAGSSGAPLSPLVSM